MSTANRTWALIWAALALLSLAAGYVAARWEDIPERFAPHFGTCLLYTSDAADDIALV